MRRVSGSTAGARIAAPIAVRRIVPKEDVASNRTASAPHSGFAE
jgi:hypothetical protein